MAEDDIRSILTQALIEAINPVTCFAELAISELADQPPAGIAEFLIHNPVGRLLKMRKSLPAGAPEIG
jgi:hypothetical protein